MKWHCAVLILLISAACEDTNIADPLPSAQLEIVAAPPAQAAVGSALGAPVIVRLRTKEGRPLSGATINWHVIEGGGATDSVSTVTDAQGQARVQWQLGSDPGPQALLASTRTANITLRTTGILQFTSIAGGFRHTCALGTNGLAYCWGANNRGQLGNGQQVATSLPVEVAGRLRFTALTAGWFHTCGITALGEAFCWGENSVGQLGSPGGDALTPRNVNAALTFVSIGAGYQHTCAVATGGAAYCWGSDDKRMLGAGTSTPACSASGALFCTSSPQRVQSAKIFASVTAGEFHTCAVATDGFGHCWGWNSSGELGTGAPFDAVLATPSQLQGVSTYRSNVAGTRHTCALRVDGAAECWGRNGAGETGIEPFISIAVPVPVNTTLRFENLGTGDTHTCAATTDLRAFCWGSELGNGTGGSSKIPVPVSLPAAVTAVGVGWQHACAIVTGELWCWGSNSHGQLGVTGTTRSNTPIRVQIATS